MFRFIATSLFVLFGFILIIFYGSIFVAVGFLMVGFVVAYDTAPFSRPIHRNFPIFSRVYSLLFSRNKIVPYSKDVKNYIVRCSENKDIYSFGVKDIEKEKYISHAAFPSEIMQLERIVVGANCNKPYISKVINISAMGFGPLSSNTVSALSDASKIFGCSINTGEDGYSIFHAKAPNVVYQIGPDYSGAKTGQGHLDREVYRKIACQKNVSMIEIKLSQGGKPGMGCNLPQKKISKLVAETQKIKFGEELQSSHIHSEFSNWTELLIFIEELRNLSGGKPVGIKLCIGKCDDLKELIKEILRKEINPDFITVDGAEGGSGSSTLSFLKYVGMPLLNGISILDQLLTQHKLRDKIKIIASGKISTPYDVFKVLHSGADICNVGRSLLISMGCEQALKCHSGRCPSGLATHNFFLQSGVIVGPASTRVYNYLVSLENGLMQLMGACGYKNFYELKNGSPFNNCGDAYSKKGK